jgi:hypothetical protein
MNSKEAFELIEEYLGSEIRDLLEEGLPTKEDPGLNFDALLIKDIGRAVERWQNRINGN